ncbi:hypothetical protein ACQPXM_04230 [Kribbella sp. CA-253562]|uniref:hypothetical protein n=1 Tax=Kribbella sp. CA-253562 TaxID=3239942 RepID=UPI003D93C28E
MSSARSKVILGLTQALQILAADDHASVSELRARFADTIAAERTAIEERSS